MPQFTPQDFRVDVPLTNITIGYRNPAYIADTIAPLVPVNERSGIVPKFVQSFWFRDGAHLRQAGTPSQGGGFAPDITDTYYCHRYSFRWELDDDTRRQAQEPWRLEDTGAIFVTDKMQMRREIGFATSLFTTGVWTGDVVGGVDFTRWSDYAASTPLVDAANYMDVMEGRIGIEPNNFVVGKQVWLKMKWHPDFIETIKYTQRGQPTPAIVESLFELPAGGLKIGRSIYTTSPQGTAEASVTYTRIWGKAGLWLYVPSGPSLMTPAAAYSFIYQLVPNAAQYIKRMRNEEREVDIIEGNSYFAQKKCAAGAGLYMSQLVV